MLTLLEINSNSKANFNSTTTAGEENWLPPDAFISRGPGVHCVLADWEEGHFHIPVTATCATNEQCSLRFSIYCVFATNLQNATAPLDSPAIIICLDSSYSQSFALEGKLPSMVFSPVMLEYNLYPSQYKSEVYSEKELDQRCGVL